MPESYQPLIDDIFAGNIPAVRSHVRRLAEEDGEVMGIIENGLLKAMKVIGDRFENNEIYVTELLVTARAVHAGLEGLRPYMKGDVSSAGRIVIGTVAGDLHDIGKNLLAMLLQGYGYEVIDLGVDVSANDFVSAINKYRPDAVCLSALLSTTTKSMIDTVEALKDAHMRNSVTLAVGGAAVTAEIASGMGADIYAATAPAGAKQIDQLVQKNRGKEELASFTSVIHLDEILAVQKSFRALSGLNIVLVDKKGRPIVDPGGFFECSRHCSCWTATTSMASLDKTYRELSLIENSPRAFAYRCRCGLVEISYPLIGEAGQIGAILIGHFLLEGDIKCEDAPAGIPVVPADMCQHFCEYISVIGQKLVDLVDCAAHRRRLESQQGTFVNFMRRQHQLEEALKEAELKVLQYQVTPHFLFNALNTIARIALFEGDQYTEKLVTALARLMRYSLYQVKSTVTVAEEIKMVQDYLMIQAARFQGRISHRVDIEPAIMNARMPSMILQPLVENACQHGLEPCKGAGIVTVQGWLENEQVFLEVTDNGVGMSDELKKNIFKLENIKSQKGGQVSGLGLNNVLRRLQAHFGSDCAWDINSTINKGTTFQISFPYVM